jgi:hypothetical protein
MSAQAKMVMGLLVLTALAACAKLPLDNEAPAAPVIASDGILTPYGVAVQVTVDDPDADRVTLHFRADNGLGGVQDFAWTSFIDSGQDEVFYLGLNVGQWTLTARARDEWEELSPTARLDVQVVLP